MSREVRPGPSRVSELNYPAIGYIPPTGAVTARFWEDERPKEGRCYNLRMKGEVSLFITTVSGLLSLAVGFYIIVHGRQKAVNFLFFLLTLFLALWSVGEAMTVASPSLDMKVFWTRFQGIGELPLIPTFLLLSLFFPEVKNMVRGKARVAAAAVALYSPFLLGLFLLYLTDLVYSEYRPGTNLHGLEVARTPFFWLLTALGFLTVLAGMANFAVAGRQSDSLHRRRGLLLLAAAPLPMLVANLVQNLRWNDYVTTPQAGLLFAGMIAYGIMHHGLFLDFKSATRSALAHATVIAVDLTIFFLLTIFFSYGLGMSSQWTAFFLFFAFVIPAAIAYPVEVKWARNLLSRHLYLREARMESLLEELSRSIRTVRGLENLASEVTQAMRESLGLSATALMVWDREAGVYRVVGFSSDVSHMTHEHRGVVGAGMFMRHWGDRLSFDTPGGEYSSYWELGRRLSLGGCDLHYLRLGILRLHKGNGMVTESLWTEEENGEAFFIPLEVGGERVGLLWLGGKMNGARFTREELGRIVALTAQISVSLFNDRLMQEVVEKGERLRRLAHRTLNVQEEERARVSRELHDVLAPCFLEVLFRLDALEKDLPPQREFREHVEEIKERMRSGLRELRGLIADLRPSSLEVLGLRDSLSSYLGRFGAENGMEVEFSCQGSLNDLDSLAETTVYRVVQEALSNVARHSRARKVSLSMREGDGFVYLEVRDDGVGFRPEDLRSTIREGECLGIKGMEERVELVQGRLAIVSEPGNGTRVCLAVPKQRT